MADDVPINAGIGTLVETLQQTDLSHRQVMHLADLCAAMKVALSGILNPAYVNGSAQMRVSIEATGSNLTISTITTIGTVTTVTTVGTVTTVASVTNLVQIGGKDASTLILDGMTSMWAGALRGSIQ